MQRLLKSKKGAQERTVGHTLSGLFPCSMFHRWFFFQLSFSTSNKFSWEKSWKGMWEIRQWCPKFYFLHVFTSTFCRFLFRAISQTYVSAHVSVAIMHTFCFKRLTILQPATSKWTGLLNLEELLYLPTCSCLEIKMLSINLLCWNIFVMWEFSIKPLWERGLHDSCFVLLLHNGSSRTRNFLRCHFLSPVC